VPVNEPVVNANHHALVRRSLARCCEATAQREKVATNTTNNSNQKNTKLHNHCRRYAARKSVKRKCAAAAARE